MIDENPVTGTEKPNESRLFNQMNKNHNLSEEVKDRKYRQMLSELGVVNLG